MKSGFAYTRRLRDHQGRVIFEDAAPIHNLMPIEGVRFEHEVMLGRTAAPAHLYLGLYGNLYTPTPEITAATLQVTAGEIQNYSQLTRPEFVAGVPDDFGTVTNADSVAVFTFTTAKRVQGSFMSTASAKGSGSGVILSIVKYPDPIDVPSGSTLELLASRTIFAPKT